VEKGGRMKTIKPSEHELVPMHILLTEDEMKNVLKRYGITREQFPKIKVSDPAAAEIGAKLGDLIKIIRKSPTAGEAIAYRWVIE
jgi:DNA-directed RNA polymerase subunit H